MRRNDMLAMALILAAGPTLAQTTTPTTTQTAAPSIFTPTSDGFVGEVSASGPDGAPIYPDSTATIEGEELTPGQSLTLMRGTTALTPQPVTVGADGSFKVDVPVPADAATGLQPVVVIAENPAAATVVDMKISPRIPLSGADKFEIKQAPATLDPYQVAYSAKNNTIFIAGAVGRPPISKSELVKLDADSLEKLAAITPAATPDGKGVFAVYTVALDDEAGTVWVSNTRQGTVAIYRQDDLSLIHQLEPTEDGHPRDITLHDGKAYVTQSLNGNVWVYDMKTYARLDPIKIKSGFRGSDFGAMSTDLDGDTLVTVSLNTPEAAEIDLSTGAVKVIPAKGAKSASGVAYDPQDGLVFVGSQETDNLLMLKADTGEVVHDVEVGPGVLSVAFEPKSRLIFTANRENGTVSVVNLDGEIVAVLDMGGLPNQVRADGRGNVYAVAKGHDTGEGNNVWKITPKS